MKIKLLILILGLSIIFACGSRGSYSYSSHSRSRLQQEKVLNDSVHSNFNVDTLAYYIGGPTEFAKQLNDSLVYPDLARINEIEGVVIVSCVLGSDSKFRNFGIESEILGGNCEDAAISAVRKTVSNWIPAKKDGKNVSTRLVFQIEVSDTKINSNIKSRNLPYHSSYSAYCNSVLSGSLGVRYSIQLDHNVKAELSAYGQLKSLNLEEIITQESANKDLYEKLARGLDGFWLPAIVNNIPQAREIEEQVDREIVNSDSTKSYCQSNYYMSDSNSGQDELRKMLSENISYPREAREAEFSGSVIVSFTIDKKGQLGKYFILSPWSGYGLEYESIRVLGLSSGLWSTAKCDGKAVDMRYSIPINYQIY